MKIKLNLKLLNKLTAILVVGCFFISSVCRDAIATAATPTMNAQEFKQIFNDFMLPYSYGKISGSYFAGTDRVVINIQDLHCHPQVQKSISSIIEMFDNKYGISNIYLEGAYGNVSAKPFLQNLINPTQKNEILDKLLESGRLTGAEYYSATSNKTEIIKGLEKKDPYLENLKRFGNLLEVQDQIAIILKGVEESTRKVKKQYYTRRQYKIEKLSNDYLKGKIKAEKYYRLLAKHTEKLGIDLTKYENTFLYMQLLALQGDLDYKAITTQLQTLVLLLKENLPPNAYQILLDNTKNFEQTDKLYAYVIKLSKSFGLDLAVNFKELDKYFNFIELTQRINPLELLKEEENLTREINTRFSDTIAQREVVFLTNFEKYLKDYLSTKITSQDYEYYKENIETYKKLWNKYVDNKVLTLLEPYMKETDKFYKINTDRNNYFTENIFDGTETNRIENIKEEPNEVSKIIENMDKVKRLDVIITGGFHSQTVSDILKQHGISYIVITPNVQDGVKEAEKTYYQIAKQQKEINFQTLAAMNIFQVYGIEAATTAFIKELKDANISVVDANTLLGNKYNRLVNEIFEMSDEEFENKYGSQQSEYSTNDFAQALITQVAQSLESDDIDISALEKITQIVAKAYGVDDVSDEKLYELSLAAINDEQTDSFFSSFINIFNAKKSDVSNAVEKCLTIRNNTPSIMQSFLNEASEDSYGYDTKKNNEENSGLFYKNKFGENVYLEEYVAEDERTKENLRLNLQNLRDKEEQLRLEKEKEDLEKDSEKNIDKTDKEKQTPTLLDLVTPKFSSKGAAALVTIVATVATLFIPTLSLPTRFNKSQDTDEIQEQDIQQEKDSITMLSIFLPLAKKFENTKVIGQIFSFLDKTAPVWEELVFRAIPMIMSPGIFIVSQIIFILLHFKELNTKEKLTVTVLTIGLSSIYVGMSICFPGTLPLAYAIAMIIHAINNKYGQVKLSIFDKVKNMFKGNNKLQEILDSLAENFDGKDFFVNFINFAELENKDEINRLVDILNNVNTRTPYMTERSVNLIVNTIKNVDNEMYDLISKKDFQPEYYNSKIYREFMSMLKNIDSDIDYKDFHKKITEKVINILRNDEVSDVKELNESIKEKICDNFSNFLFTEDEISLLKNLLRQNNDNIEQILDSFAGIKQFDDDVLSRQIWFRERSFISNFKTFLSDEKNIDNFNSFIGKLGNKLNAKDNYSDADRNAIRTDLLMFLFRDEEIFDYFINSEENQDILLSNLSIVNIESDKEYNGAIDFYRLPTDVGINLLMGYVKPVNLKEWYIQSPVNTNQISKMETTTNPIFKCGDERNFWEENKEVAKQRNCNDADKTKFLFDAFCNSGLDVSKNSSIDRIFKEKTGFSIDEIKNGITKDIMFRRNEKDLKKEQIKYSSEDIMAMYSDDIVYAIATIMKQRDEEENNIRNTNFSKLTKGINYSFKCPLFAGPCFVPYSEILNTGYIIGDCTGSLANGKNNVYFRNHRIFLKNFNTIIYYKDGKLIQKYMIHYDDNDMHIMSVEEHQDFRDNKNNQEDRDIDFKEQFFFESLDFINKIAENNKIANIYIETLNSNTGWLMETISQVTTKEKSKSVNLLTQGGAEQLLKLNVDFNNINKKINEIKEKSKEIKAYRLLTGTGVYGDLVSVMYEIQDFIRNIDEYKYKNDEKKGILYRQIQKKIQKEEDSVSDDDFARKIKIQQKANDLLRNVNNVLKLERLLNNENIEMKNNKIKIMGGTDVFDNFINNFSEIVRYIPTYKLPGDEKGDLGFVLPIGNNKNVVVELVKNGNVSLADKQRYTKIKDESDIKTDIPNYYTDEDIKQITDEIDKVKTKQINFHFKNKNVIADECKIDIRKIEKIKNSDNLKVTFGIIYAESVIGFFSCEIRTTDKLKTTINDGLIETKLMTDNEMDELMDKIRSYNLDDRMRNVLKGENVSEVTISFKQEEINESKLTESKTISARSNQQETAISQNVYDTTKEDSNLTIETIKLLRKSLNPVGALSEISIEFLGSEIINADKLFLYKHDISEAELKKAEKDGCTSIKYRIVNEAETSMGVSNIKIKQGEGKADIRVKYDGKNKEVIIYSKDGIQNLSDYEVQSLIKQAFKEGRKMKVFDKVDTLAFATGKEKTSNDMMNTMNVEIIDSSVVAPTENVYKFASDEKFMSTTISGKMKETGLSTFEISKEHYDEYGIKEQDCKFIVRETNINNIEQAFDNIGDNQSGVSFDFSENDMVNQESILNSIKEQKGKSKKTMNLSVYVKFDYEVYEKLSEINIFEQYGIIPIVDKNSASIVKGKKMLDIDEENKIEDIEKLKNQSDIFGFMFDENSVDKLGSVISGIRTIIEYLTNDKSIYSPQEKFKDGLCKALNLRNLKKSNKYEFNCAINDLTEIQSLEELLQIDIAQEKVNDRIKEQLNSLNLSKIFTNDALIYIEDLISKDNNIEALGFIRGVVMNTIADDISKELSDKGIGDVDIRDSIEDNEIQGILIWTIQNLLEGKAIEDLYNDNKDTFETGTAEEIFESIRLDLNKILAENEYRINLAKERSTIAKSEELPTLIMSDYGKKGVAEKEFNVSANAIKSMLAAA